MKHLLFFIFLTCASALNSTFIKKGQIFENIAFIHLSFDIPIQHLLNDCTHLTNIGHRLKTIKHNTSILWLSGEKDNLDFLNKRLNKQCLELTYEPDNIREKRGILSFAIGSTLGAILSAFGFSNYFNNNGDLKNEINTINHHIEIIDHNIFQNHEIIQKIIQKLNTVESMESNTRQLIGLEHIMTDFEMSVINFLTLVDKLTEAYHLLHMNQLSQTLVPQSTISTIWPKLNLKTEELGGYLPIQHPSQIYQLPISTFQNSDNWRIIIHIPITSHQNPFALFKIIQKPILIQNQQPPSTILAHITPEHEFIAINNKDSIPISAQELAQCITIANTYLCNSLIIETNPFSCISKLFHNNIENLPSSCPIFIEPIEHTFISQQDHWLGYSEKQITITTICRNGSVNTQQHQNIFKLPYIQNCRYSTQNYKLSGSPNIPQSQIEVKTTNNTVYQELINTILSSTDIQDFLNYFPVNQSQIPILPLLTFQRQESWHSALHQAHSIHFYLLLSLFLLFTFIFLSLIICTIVNFSKTIPLPTC